MKFLPGFTTFDNVFDTMLSDPFFQNSKNYMKTDVKEVDNHYVFDMDIPGFKKDDLNLELKDGYLIITANKDDRKEETDTSGNIIRQERYTGTCARSFYVGDSIKERDIKANYQDGVLKITVPKTEPQKIDTKSYIPIE